METNQTSIDNNFNQTKTNESQISNNSTSAKGNFKTFALLRKQENLISQFGSNLQKTLELLNKKPNESSFLHEEFHQTTKTNSDLSYQLKDSETNQNDYLMLNRMNLITKEKENELLKTNITNLERENEILKSSINTLALSKKPIETFDEGNKKCDGSIQVLELRNQVDELNKENEQLREEIIKIKADMFKKYEQLQKNNDDLLVSYEERFNINMKNMQDRYENDLNDLQSENKRLREKLSTIDKKFAEEKAKLQARIDDLERDKQSLIVKISNLNSTDTIDSNFLQMMSPLSQQNSTYPGISNVIIDQLLKEKNDYEKKYNDLFSSYECLLEHNRMLVANFENMTNKQQGISEFKDVSSPRMQKIYKKKLELDNDGKEYPSRKELKSHRKNKYENLLDNEKPIIVIDGEGGGGGGVGKIRKNKERGPNESINNISGDEEKLAKSHSKSTDLSHYTSTILKPKNHQMNLDELKNDVSNFEEKIKYNEGESGSTKKMKSSAYSQDRKKFLVGTPKENNKRNANKLQKLNGERESSKKIKNKGSMTLKKISQQLDNGYKTEQISIPPELKNSATKRNCSVKKSSEESTTLSNSSARVPKPTKQSENSPRKSAISNVPSSRSTQKIPIYSKVKRQ